MCICVFAIFILIVYDFKINLLYSSDYLTEEIEFDIENDKISSESNNDGKLIDNFIIYD